ncbi:acylphosphatase, partial [Halomonas sp. SIMBA_159]
GIVRNGPAGVTIEAQGTAGALDRFARAIETRLPPLARVDHAECEAVPRCLDERDFTIADSDVDASADAVPRVTADLAVCDDCLREMRDP